jgi:hypothetical protein
MGPVAAPDGGARLTAAPGSGTDAGGTGGGRSLNNCACAEDATVNVRRQASTAANPAPRLSFLLLPPQNIIAEFLAVKRGEFKPPNANQDRD